ncbi:hypothetical protein [Priestia aryabhattai]|uniref:Uncharacterized protein n=1 Tax=Priestia aryabhattai TaxID=412384 RepID=A0ABD5KZT5_PRIAR
MDAQITSSVIGGVVGAIAGGIVPYMIYLSTEKKKKKEKQLEYLHILEKEIEDLSYKSNNLKFNLQKQDNEKYSDEIIAALENIRTFMTKDLYEIQHTIPHYALFIDSETLYKSTTFLKNIKIQASEGQNKISELRTKGKNQTTTPQERAIQHVKQLITDLEFIEKECDVLKGILVDKVNHYYESYQKKYIKV